MYTHQRAAVRSQVILYSFYKNIALVMTLFFFGFFSAHSGTTLFESWIGAGWNVGWTFLPILSLGVLDQDIKKETILKCPAVYKSGQANSSFSPRKLFQVSGCHTHALVLCRRRV